MDRNGGSVESVSMSDGSSADTSSLLDLFFNDLIQTLGDNTGAASIGMNAAFPDQPPTTAQAAPLTQAPPETLTQFINSIVATVENTSGASTVTSSNIPNG
jgi:hypothetical protein